MRNLAALFVLLAGAAGAGDPTLDDLYDASELIVAGKVLSHRESLETGRTLALVETTRTFARRGDLAKRSVRSKIFVSFATGAPGKAPKGALDVGQSYLLFFERRATHGEFHPVLEGKGVEVSADGRLKEVGTFCGYVPACSYAHGDVKPDGKEGKCASCGL
jgi:hypothetical protein